MLTNVWQWLRRSMSGSERLPNEFRAEQMDANWRPEYLEIRGHVPPATTRAPHLMYR